MKKSKADTIIQVEIPKDYTLRDSKGNIVETMLQIKWEKVKEAINDIDKGILELTPLRVHEIKDDTIIPVSSIHFQKPEKYAERIKLIKEYQKGAEWALDSIYDALQRIVDEAENEIKRIRRRLEDDNKN